MNGTVFQETLRRSWRGMLYWGSGLGLYGFFIASFIQDANVLKQYGEIVKSMPPAMLQMFGMDVNSIATPEGFLGYGFFAYGLLIMSVYAILNGLSITANDEDQGIMDIVLSLPLARWRIVTEKFLAYSLMAAGIILMVWVGLYIGNQASALKVDAAHLTDSVLNILPGTLFVMAFTALAAVVFRSKGLATGAAAVFVIASYFLNFLGDAARDTIAGQLRALSFFYYNDHNGVIQNGMNWGNFGLLAVLSVILFGTAIAFFQRRDIGV